MTKRPFFYSRWRNIRQRCTNARRPDYHRYGGRGIKVCKLWNSYAKFEAWCKKTYKPGLTLDRKNNDGPYSPSNCKWSTMSEQCRNREFTLAARAHLTKHRWRGGYAKVRRTV